MQSQKPIIHFNVLGGTEEIGANSTFLNFGGTGIIIDAGLHPKNRSLHAFPAIHSIEDEPTDALLITHAHTDHIGALPYILKEQPYLRLITTALTRDITSVMLQNTNKLIRDQIDISQFKQDALSLYTKETAEYISTVFETYSYKEPFEIIGRRGIMPVKCTFFDAGHIPGSAGILCEWNGLSVFHTGDVQFKKQTLIPGASFPKHHIDILFCESTNGAKESEELSFANSKAELAKFINAISNQNGSILIPSFALGKTQEILCIIFEMQQKGLIPTLPIYSGGMGKKISAIVDRYCYTSPRIKPGFEIADIPQIDIPYDDIEKGPYFSTPSIVIASSGMMNPGTISYKLAHSWMQKRNYGIAFIGWQDPDAPGYALCHSEPNQKFMFGPHAVKRQCAIKNFRFSAHACKEDLLGFIEQVQPKLLVLLHGDQEACESLAASASNIMHDGMKILLPKQGKKYSFEKE